MTKSSKQAFNKFWVWALAFLASANLLVILGGVIILIGFVGFLVRLKSGLTQSSQTFAQAGVIDLRPIPIGEANKITGMLSALRRQDVLEKSQALLALVHQLQTTDQRILLIFQGSDELRPTGGFMGAYGIATFRGGILTDLTFEDIYDAAGQMKTRFEPPPGVAEYTSGGEGWKLPDANWDPDFPASVQTITAMMRDAGKGEFTGVVTINTSVLADLLHITGPVSLPEYQTVLSVETVDELLSAHREEFFAGSRAKVIMLQQSFSKMLYSLATLKPRQQVATAKLVMHALDQKSVQIWHSDEGIQRRLVSASAAGTLPTTSYIALIEANVGINKINEDITRQVRFWWSEELLHMQVEWHNNALTIPDETQTIDTNPNRKPFIAPAPEADHNAYVDYLRVLTSEDVRVASGSATELIITLPGHVVTREYVFTVPPEAKVSFWKQSGIDTTSLSVGQKGGWHVLPFLGDTIIPADR